MSNKELINKAIDEINKEYNVNLQIGIYHKKIDELSRRSINRIIPFLGEYADIAVSIKGEKYMVELACVDNEVDVMIMKLDKYKDRYF